MLSSGAYWQVQYIILPILLFAVQGKRDPADATDIHKGCDGDNPRGRCVFGLGHMLLWLRPGNHLAKIRGRGWKLLARCRIDAATTSATLVVAPGYCPSSSAISCSRIATCLRSSRAARRARANGFRWIGVQPGVVPVDGRNHRRESQGSAAMRHR